MPRYTERRMTVRVGLAHVSPRSFDRELVHSSADSTGDRATSEKKRERETVVRSTIRRGKPLFAAAETSSANSNNEIVTELRHNLVTHSRSTAIYFLIPDT